MLDSGKKVDAAQANLRGKLGLLTLVRHIEIHSWSSLMRKAAMLIIFALLTVGIGTGQTPQGSTSPTSQQTPISQNQATQNAGPAATGITQVTAGTEIHAALDTPLSTKTSKPGDRFTASITDPVSTSDGAMVIPGGSRVEGEVAEADEDKAMAFRGKGKLNLRFRDIVLPNGQTLPLTATLISVNDINGKNLKRAEGQARPGTQNDGIARSVGAGAGMSTAAGFGSPLKGLAIGSLSGGGYVLAIKGKEVNLPAQTGMVIRLDQAVSSSGNR
jgi:hypothetical protein